MLPCRCGPGSDIGWSRPSPPQVARQWPSRWSSASRFVRRRWCAWGCPAGDGGGRPAGLATIPRCRACLGRTELDAASAAADRRIAPAEVRAGLRSFGARAAAGHGPNLFIGWMGAVLITGKSAALAQLGLVSASAQLWFLTGMAALVVIAAAAVPFLAGRCWLDLAQSVQHAWRTEMYAHVQRAGLRYLEGERTTRLARVLTDDVDQLGRFFASSGEYFVQLATISFVLVPLFLFLFLAPGMAWIAFLPVPFLPVPIIAWLSFHHHERAAPAHAASGERGALLSSQLINNLGASATVKSFGAEDYEIDRIHRLSEAYRQSNHQVDISATAYTQTVRVCAMVSFVEVLLWGASTCWPGVSRSPSSPSWSAHPSCCWRGCLLSATLPTSTSAPWRRYSGCSTFGTFRSSRARPAGGWTCRKSAARWCSTGSRSPTRPVHPSCATCPCASPPEDHRHRGCHRGRQDDHRQADTAFGRCRGRARAA